MDFTDGFSANNICRLANANLPFSGRHIDAKAGERERERERERGGEMCLDSTYTVEKAKWIGALF